MNWLRNVYDIADLIHDGARRAESARSLLVELLDFKYEAIFDEKS
jgi:hypothetical protein